MRKIALLLFLISLPVFSQSEEEVLEQAAKDTLVFRHLHFEKPIAPTVELKLFSKYYNYLKHGGKRYTAIDKINRLNRELQLEDKRIFREYNPSTLKDMGNEEIKGPFLDMEFERLKMQDFERVPTPQQMEALRRDSLMYWNSELGGQYAIQHGKYPANAKNVKRFHRRAEMKDLVRRLETLRDSCKNLPIFFTDIDSKFNGNIQNFVHHLYSKTIMGNWSIFTRFIKNPTIEAIQSDLGVQYAVGLALYELWIKDVREGKVK